jgi:hypothetical protein
MGSKGGVRFIIVTNAGANAFKYDIRSTHETFGYS